MGPALARNDYFFDWKNEIEELFVDRALIRWKAQKNFFKGCSNIQVDHKWEKIKFYGHLLLVSELLYMEKKVFLTGKRYGRNWLSSISNVILQ